MNNINLADHYHSARQAVIDENDFPFRLALEEPDHALAVITAVEGPSYRRCGAAMLIHVSGRVTGNLSSGCIDKNVVQHAIEALSSGEIKRLRYGRGSPYWDMPLPCGGGLEIMVIPRPDQLVLSQLKHELDQRKTAHFSIDQHGKFSAERAATGLNVSILPQVRILVFGTGREVICFSFLAQAAGCRVEVYSHDADVLEAVPLAHVHQMDTWPDNLAIDARTAVVTFYHDHDWEPPILSHALQSEAFFVGAQGSQRAYRMRCEALKKHGCTETMLSRLTHPLGLIPSTRDPQTLAVSVLAQVLQNVTTAVVSGAKELVPVAE